MRTEERNVLYEQIPEDDIKARSQLHKRLRFSGIIDQELGLPSLSKTDSLPQKVILKDNNISDKYKVILKDEIRKAFKSKKIRFNGIPGKDGKTFRGEGDLLLGGTSSEGKTRVTISATNYYADGSGTVYQFYLTQEAVNKIKIADNYLELSL